MSCVDSRQQPKKRPFGSRPKRKGMEEEDYVCPMNLELPPGLQWLVKEGAQNGTKPTPSYRVEVRSAGKVHRQEDEVGQAWDRETLPRSGSGAG